MRPIRNSIVSRATPPTISRRYGQTPRPRLERELSRNSDSSAFRRRLASAAKISLYFPAEQGNTGGDGFAKDCLHRQALIAAFTEPRMNRVTPMRPLQTVRR